MMQKIMNAKELESAIEQLEFQHAEEWNLLKGHVRETYENFKPINIIKNSIDELTESPELKGKVIATTVALAAGIVSKTLLVGRSHNPLTNMAGTLLQFGISTLIAKNPETIKTISTTILSFFSKKKSVEENEATV